MILARNSSFFQFVFSVKIVRKLVFEYFLFSKQSFLDYKKYPSYMVKKLFFSKRVNQLFWPKNDHFFNFVFSVKIVFEYVLHRKQAFLDYKNINLI